MNSTDIKTKTIQFLEESPFDDDYVAMWKEKILKMGEKDLEELNRLLQEKLKVITDANQLFLDMAASVVKEQEEEKKQIPEERTVEDISLDDFTDIFKHHLNDLLSEADPIKLVDRYFIYSKETDEDVSSSFELIVKKIEGNEENFVGKNKVGKWLSLYNQEHDKENRKGINRINFANNNSLAKKLTKIENKRLLKLLKLYDYLLNPVSVVVSGDGKTEVKHAELSLPHTVGEKEIKDLQKEETEFAEGSIERLAMEEEIEKLKHIEDLKAERNKYKEGSLEFSALSEEINHLENTK